MCLSCKSRQEFSNEYLLAKLGVDTAENEPSTNSNFIPTQAIQFHILIAPCAGAPDPWDGRLAGRAARKDNQTRPFRFSTSQFPESKPIQGLIITPESVLYTTAFQRNETCSFEAGRVHLLLTVLSWRQRGVPSGVAYGSDRPLCC